MVIAQSNACLLYLGRKFGLAGATEEERVRVDQAVCQVLYIYACMYIYGCDL